jgi:hypothetical protein
MSVVQQPTWNLAEKVDNPVPWLSLNGQLMLQLS